MAFLARLVVDVVHTTAITLRAYLVTLIARPAGNRHSVLIYGSIAVTFSAVRLELNGRDVVVVGIGPVRLYHEAVVTPVLIGIEPRVLHPHGIVHKALQTVISLSALSEPMIVLPKSLVVLSKTLVISPLVVLVWILPLVVLVVPQLIRLVGIGAIISPPLVLTLIASPLVWLVSIVTPCVVVLIGILPLVVLVAPPLALSLSLSLIGIEALVGIIAGALVGIVAEALSLVSPHLVKFIGYTGQ